MGTRRWLTKKSSVQLRRSLKQQPSSRFRTLPTLVIAWATRSEARRRMCRSLPSASTRWQFDLSQRRLARFEIGKGKEAFLHCSCVSKLRGGAFAFVYSIKPYDVHFGDTFLGET